MKRFRRLLQFFDWRFWTSLFACGLTAVLILSLMNERTAELTADASRRRASLRITDLTQANRLQQIQIRQLEQQQGRNTEAIKALSAQIHQEGQTPVVTTPTTAKRTTTTASAKNQPTRSPQSPATTTPGTTTPQQSSTTTTSTTRPPTTTTTRPCLVPNVCIKGVTQ